MKTRIITAAVGLGVLAVVLAFFDTFLFDLVLSAVCLIAIHEVFSAMGFGKKQWYLYAAAVPLTLLVMLSTSQMVRGLLLPAAFLTVLFYNVCQIAHVKTLDFGKLTGFVYFSGVITFCFYSLIHLKRMLPFAEYRYDAIYFILLILCFAWGGDTAAYFAGRAFGRHKLAPIVSPHKTVEGAVGGVLGSMAAGCVLTLVYSLLSAKSTSSAFRYSRSIIWCCWAWVPWHRCWAFWATCSRRPSSARSASRITARSSRGTAAFWTALTASCSSRPLFPSRCATSSICCEES